MGKFNVVDWQNDLLDGQMPTQLTWHVIDLTDFRFLVSSVERLKPIFEYAIVTAVYLNNDIENGIDRSVNFHGKYLGRGLSNHSQNGYVVTLNHPFQLSLNTH